ARQLGVRHPVDGTAADENYGRSGSGLIEPDRRAVFRCNVHRRSSIVVVPPRSRQSALALAQPGSSRCRLLSGSPCGGGRGGYEGVADNRQVSVLVVDPIATRTILSS